MSLIFPDPLWRKVFELAWESYVTGGWGVGAITLDADGQLLTEGRNRGGDTEALFRQLDGSSLGHAELNALAALPDDVPRTGVVVRTSLEPCTLCASAIALRRVARVEYAAVDPLWHGLWATHRTHPFLAQRWPEHVGPLTDDSAGLAVVAEALTLSRYLRTRGRGATATRAYATHSPSLLGLAEELAEDDDVLRLDLDSFLTQWDSRIAETQPTRLRAVVVRLGPDDWERARDVRIASLAQAPRAFGSTVADALAFDEARWRSRLETATTWHAVLGDRSVGTVTLRADEETARDAEITGMWVDPEARGRGVGAQLIETAVATWRALHGRRVVLWVVQGNGAAEALYGRCGFTSTGRTEPQDDGRVEIELARVL
ncbi:GNAT family N-acetyltransferase [Angustibacter sp. McL0619]|uniref:GNAT family N-acetyltransferase n=1 Tax=Angustibacter sp. McL0619 TaxID=3415676 RepID=UPI003CE95978